MDFPFVKEAISQLFSKPSCAMYPAVPSEAAPNYRGRIVYHADKCIGCGMCERVCAGNAISRTVEKTEEGDKITLTFNLGSCTFCATCADFCSRKAIELTGDYHMIATKEEDLLVTMEAVYEFNLRGFEFAPMSLYESDATKFLIRDGKLLPPFVAISGLGESAAWNLVACREGGREFVSVEELSAACPKVSQTHLEQLRNMGALGEMPDSSQMSLF